jgi:UDP-glucuronate 4-epimerase
MKALVTGAAGFIGSTLCERLVAGGWSVRGVDCFTPYYSAVAKRRNLTDLLALDSFELIDVDLVECDLEPLFDGVGTVFHLAGQPGVRLSWSEEFETYLALNVTVTQRLLERARVSELDKFVLASSSSVYGNRNDVPTKESAPTNPHSPYGVTKLAADRLCSAYGENFGVPTVSLRYFTVYGPRQRPDMALHRMIEACSTGRSFTVFGDGEQIRDFTFVDDVVDATVRAGTSECAPGDCLNIAGTGGTTVNELVDIVNRAVGSKLNVIFGPTQPGDVRRTGGDTSRALSVLGWTPKVSIEDGVARQVQWHKQLKES